jgi:acetylornithine deacetylase/succinyl-diaminopimelate desuccinylase-like protein
VRLSAHLLSLLLATVTPTRVLQAQPPTAEQTLEWLQTYLGFDSSTVEGAGKSASYLRGLLHQAGVPTKWIVSPEQQPFLYARTGSAEPDAPTLVLLHHVDVVPVGPGWSHPPFGAQVDAGALFGRGAVDDKSLGIAHLISFLRFRQLASPTYSLVFLAVGGEETGGIQGTGWLVENHPELFDNVHAVLTEGGTNRLYGDRLAWWAIEVAQKRPLWIQATAHGRPGHGSGLNLHSAPHRLIRALDKLVDRPLEFRLTPEARLFLESVAPLESPAFQDVVANLEAILERRDAPKGLLPGMPNYLLDTIQVNTLDAGEKVNVTPGVASAQIDIRLLPDTDSAKLLAELEELMGPEIELEILLTSPEVEPSPVDHPVFRCLEDTLGSSAPVVPAFINAVTDARFLRQGGIPVYGFLPFELDSDALRGIHSKDEHIDLDVFAKGVDVMWNVVRECAGS